MSAYSTEPPTHLLISMAVQQIIQWPLMVRIPERRMGSSLFVREWQQLRSEFETLADFVELVTSVQCGTLKSRQRQ